MAPKLTEYEDLLANVRYDNHFHSIRDLVRPYDPDVKEVADWLHLASDFIEAAHAFVHSFTVYQEEIGDYWRTPAETLSPRCPVCGTSLAQIVPFQFRSGKEVYDCPICGWRGTTVYLGDCDDTAILLCSVLRNYIPADKVFCGVGTWIKPEKRGGHMWVEVESPDGNIRILESTGASNRENIGTYEVSAYFNDEYTFATPYGLKEFGLIPIEDVIKTLELAGAIPTIS